MIVVGNHGVLTRDQLDKLVEKTPANVGSPNATRYGMGSVWFGIKTTGLLYLTALMSTVVLSSEIYYL
jgi:hypothetical protein